MRIRILTDHAVPAPRLGRRVLVHDGVVASAQAFQYREGAGTPGDITRHEFGDEPALISLANPPTLYGCALLIDQTAGSLNSIRGYLTTDQSNSVASLPWGFLVRPYPTQQLSGLTASFGAATPPTSGPAGALRRGYILGQMNSGAAAVVKGGPIYIWCSATISGHVLGGFEAAYDAGATVLLDPRYTYNGPADSNGVVEICVNV